MEFFIKIEDSFIAALASQAAQKVESLQLKSPLLSIFIFQKNEK